MNDQDIALIRRFRPADPPHDPEVKARALIRLRREFGSAPAWHRSPRARAGRRVAIIGAVAAGAVVTVVAAQLTGVLTGGTPRSVPDATAPAVTLRTLELAAAAIEHQAAPPRPGRHQWVYTQKLNAFALTPGGEVGPEAMPHGKVKVEEWWKFDGREMAESVQNGKLHRKRILRRGEEPRPDPGFDGGAIGGPAVVNRTPNKLYDYTAGLPADPDALLARIRRDHRDKGQDVTTFGTIAMIFQDNRLIPPKTNAALYRALARIPGVRVVGDATDYAGRRGIGVIFDRGGRSAGGPIVLDPRTYRYMGNSHQAILSFAVVDEPGRRR